MELDLVTTSVSENEAFEVDNCNEAADLEAETCGLCMEVVIDRGLLDCCQHWFCFACIDNWATITNLCPLCQNEFQLITCVPVYDTVGSSRSEEESFTREDDWCVEGKNNTLSFQSYYIDENAVVCLDGNGCKIRTGSATAEGDSCLDTSIACDSCDIWYHAFCVGFNPEDTSESTWLCPRCTGQTLRESKANFPESGNSSCQENAANLVENSSGRKLSVSVADAGETAIVVSMVTGDHSVEGSNAISSPAIDVREHKTEAIQGISEFGGDEMGKPVVESGKIMPKLEYEDLGLSLSDAPFSFPSSIASSKLKENSDFHVQSEPSMDSSHDSLGKIDTSVIGNKLSESGCGVELHLGFSTASSSGIGGMKISGTDNRVGEEVSSHTLSNDTIVKDDRSTVDSQNTVIKTNGTKKRRADPSEGNEESKAKRKAKTKARYAKRSRPEGKVDPENCSTLVPGNDMQQSRETSPDIMSIVQGSEANLLKASSLRVKKIMRRSIEDKESSTVVQKLRKEIRETVRNRAAEELGENLFDPKLLAAFRAVVTGPKAEPAIKLPPLPLKARRSLLQKGKVRESLTKKIYGTSNGRRKRAWDRDCEVEFWKYRCTRTTGPEKIETLKSVLSLLRNGPEKSGTMKESEQKTENSILSRLYLADTSVLPRKDDIKPLSNHENATDSDERNAQNISGTTAKQSLAVKSAETSEGGLNSPSNVNRNSSSLIKVPAIKRAEGPVVSSLGTSSKKENTERGGDAKIDKRKWALQLLARKTASAEKGASAGGGDAAILKGNYPLLAQLPIDMRSTPAPSRYNKIPLSVRQTQLYRLTEHFLKKANLTSLCRNVETELAVADAVNIEKLVADRSNSKLVYVNLCAQELLHRSDNTQSNDTPEESNHSSPHQAAPTEKIEEEGIDKLSEPEVEAALRATGLLSDSPLGSPNCKTVSEDGNELYKDSREDEPENILELDSNPELDIYGDFEYDLGDEDYVGASAIKVSMPQPEEGEAKMKVVFSTFHSERLTDTVESTGSELVQNESSSPLEIDTSKGTLSVEDGSKKLVESDKLLSREGDEEPSAAECEELYGPEKEPLINKFSEGLSENEISGYNKSSELDKAAKQSGGQSIHEESAGGKEFDGDSQSQTNKNDGEDEEKANIDVGKQSSGVNSITKKVEAYIKEHIRPLCKSGVVSPEQYRWAVSKTTDKVMRYHSKAKSANFLIKEGEKVKRLAEQYVEAAHKRPKSDS
ncbi:uncharacterized protein At4g10930 [Punica granatum]|uniref:Uncharacterized protein At4g10930 n=1 Tax=Punica granatum TaxID=22663 RepID=A0A218XK67_PUNGR|nr:uncharacterized protein At4g10930 [Punica granatum]XP_031390831.1 uncharacterized protein At4g10930 [Punica granatum]OWM85208.1 hypothetical protein CDL15_Pgr027995 [Punica granatum]